MKNTTLLPEIKKLTGNLLNGGKDFMILKQSADGLYDIFSSITGVTVNNFRQNEIMLSTGKAISTSSAAHCLIEFMRTAAFLRGINKAVQKKKKEGLSTVHILYAGCGPYASLVTPLLSLYDQDEIKVTLIDINKKSMDSAKMLIEYLGLSNFVSDFWVTDAVKLKLDRPYDIVISETMQACLENEPYFHILRNIAHQAKKGTIFIPEKVIVDAYLTNPQLELEKMYWVNRNKKIVDKIFVGNVFELSSSNCNGKKLEGAVVIPKEVDTYFELKLFTTIKVYEDEKLESRDCSLTLPKKFYDFEKKKYAEKVNFLLNVEGISKVDTKIVEYAE